MLLSHILDLRNGKPGGVFSLALALDLLFHMKSKLRKNKTRG